MYSNWKEMPIVVAATDQEHLKIRYAHVQARFLTQLDTDLLLAAAVDPAFKHTGVRRFRLMLLLELGYRLNALSPEFRWNTYRSVYGKRAPHVPLSALIAPSEGLLPDGERPVH